MTPCLLEQINNSKYTNGCNTHTHTNIYIYNRTRGRYDVRTETCVPVCLIPSLSDAMTASIVTTLK